MDDREKNKKYIVTFTVISVVLLSLIALVNYIVDPFFQYRVRDNSYILNPMLVDAGLIKNYDYNTVVIGSSMTQNYDMSVLRNNEGVKPLKLTKGGLNLREVKYLYSIIDKSKVNTFIVTIDPPMFAIDEKWMMNQFPLYLSGGSVFDKFQYLLGYEATIRYTPVDVFLGLYLNGRTVDEIPADIRYKVNIDNIGTYAHLPIYNGEKVKSDYIGGRSVSFPDLRDIDARMADNANMVIESLGIADSGSEFIFVLSPYSVLYWYHTQISGYYPNYKQFIKLFVERVDKFDNAKVVCFYNLDEVSDLNNYADITHFNSALSNVVVNNLFTDKYVVNSNNLECQLNKLDSIVHSFKKKNEDWLPGNK